MSLVTDYHPCSIMALLFDIPVV